MDVQRSGDFRWIACHYDESRRDVYKHSAEECEHYKSVE